MKNAMLVSLLILVAVSFVNADHATKFKVRIENVSTTETLKSTSGATAPAGLSPGLFVIYKGENPILTSVMKDNKMALERLAEDGNPEPLVSLLQKQKGVMSAAVFNIPAGASTAGPIGPGGAYEFTLTANPGVKLSLAQMFGQSNDLFYSPDLSGIELFDSKGNAVNGEITSKLVLWDAGTEMNQEPGFGPDQAPRQSAPNTGKEEHKEVGPVKDNFSYPSTAQVLKITITHQ
ncbi:MAG TPA: spondin domain-containing protein [Acidobacteriota bacterium]|nr:spondin domain-containing protein [Acidobacteriota bacterium]